LSVTSSPAADAGPGADRVDGYAAALLDVAKAEGVAGRVGDELYHFARAYERHDALRQTLTDQGVPIERRLAIVEEILGAKASPLSSSLVSFLVSAGRARDLVAIIDKFVERSAKERRREVAEIRSAVPLDDEQKERLADALSKALDKAIEIKVLVDPSLLGGIVARVGDTVIDGSVRYKLEKLREAL
jgi:F-type H+-transporting ATPase subunit delta